MTEQPESPQEGVVEESTASDAPGNASEGAPQVQEAPAPKSPAEGVTYVWGTGRRKKAIARVRIRPGTGKILINKREVDKYFANERDRNTVVVPLQVAGSAGAWDVWVNVGGGGISGQAGAVSLGLARALSKALPDKESALREHRLLTRDARMPERKKPGQPGARKRFQFSKR